MLDGMGSGPMSLSQLGAMGGDFQQGPTAGSPGGVPGMIGQLLSQYDMAVSVLRQLADLEMDESRGSKIGTMAAQLNQMKVDRKREIDQMQQQQARFSAGAV